MCTGAEFAVGGQGVSALAGGVSSYYKTKAERTTVRAQADMADIQARLLESSAQDAIRRGMVDEQASRLQAARIKSDQITGYAAGNIALDSDSVVNKLTETDVLSEIDAATIPWNAMQEAFGYRREGLNQEASARNLRTQASGMSPSRAFTTTLLTGASKVATNRTKYQEAGMINKGDTLYIPAPRGRNA